MPEPKVAPPRLLHLALAFALLSAFALALAVPALACPRCLSTHYDARYFEAMEEVFRTAVADYHQAPLWNPYACGGEVGVANPQSTALAPTFLFSLAFGTAAGLKLALFFYLLAALYGGFLLARAFAASIPAALVCGLAYGGSGWFAMHLTTGHINFAGAALYPFLLLAYQRTVDGDPAHRSLLFVLPAGALIAWMAALGGTYTVPMAIVLLGVLAATDAARGRSIRPLLIVAAIGVTALVLGAARFLPLLEFVHDHPRHVAEKDGNNLFDMARMFFAWRQRLEPVSGHTYWWHEYCCHLPYLAFALALLAAFSRWSLRFVPLVLVALGIVAGTAWAYGPWWLIRMLPVYRDLRVPARYLIIVALVASLLAARGLDIALAWVAERRGAKAARWAALLMVALVFGETLAFDWPAYKDTRFDLHREPPTQPVPFYQIQSQWSEMLTGVMAHHGVLKCDEEAPLQRGELDPGEVDQVRLVDPGAGEARLVKWSPNAVTIAATLSHPTDVLVNENWNEHWVAETDGAVVVTVLDVSGRLGAHLSVETGAPTTVRFTLRYRPRSFVIGAWISAVAIPLALLLFVAGLLRDRRRDR